MMDFGRYPCITMRKEDKAEAYRTAKERYARNRGHGYKDQLIVEGQDRIMVDAKGILCEYACAYFFGVPRDETIEIKHPEYDIILPDGTTMDVKCMLRQSDVVWIKYEKVYKQADRYGFCYILNPEEDNPMVFFIGYVDNCNLFQEENNVKTRYRDKNWRFHVEQLGSFMELERS